MIGLGQDSSIDLTTLYPAPAGAWQGPQTISTAGPPSTGSMNWTPWAILFGGVLLVALVARR